AHTARDAPALQVVRGELDAHSVTRHDPDVVLAHASRDVSEDLVPVVQTNLEHHVRQRFEDDAFSFDRVILDLAVRFSRGRVAAPGTAPLRLRLLVRHAARLATGTSLVVAAA